MINYNQKIEWITGRNPKNNELYLSEYGNILSRRFLIVHDTDEPMAKYTIDFFIRYWDPKTETGWDCGRWEKSWMFNLNDESWAWTFLPLPPTGSKARETADCLMMGDGEVKNG